MSQLSQAPFRQSARFLLFLIGRFIDFNVGSVAWPFFVIVPGVLLFSFALTLKNGLGEALAVLGSMVTVTGLLLFYQNITDHRVRHK